MLKLYAKGGDAEANAEFVRMWYHGLPSSKGKSDYERETVMRRDESIDGFR